MDPDQRLNVKKPSHRATRSLAALYLIVALLSCLDPVEPTRIITGVITDTNDRPIQGAVVIVGDRHASTSAQGAFRLSDLPSDEIHPITAVAAGHTAWTLDAGTLTQFTARLRSRAPRQTPAEAPLALLLTLPQIDPVDRVVFLSVDTGVVIPVRVFGGSQQIPITLNLPVGPRTLSAISPPPAPGSPALHAPPFSLSLGAEGASSQRPLLIAPERRIAVRLDGGPTPIDRPLSGLEASLTCAGASGPMTLVGRAGLESFDGQTLSMTLLPQVDPLGARCDLVATWDLSSPMGPVRHAAFATDMPLPEAASEIGLKAPTPSLLLPEVRPGEGIIAWEAADGATLYDLFIAPDEGDQVGEPIWSATTEATEAALPRLPAEAAALMGEHAGRPMLVRVVARHVPGFDIEARWDWSNYHGFVASPWLTLPEGTLAPFGLADP